MALLHQLWQDALKVEHSLQNDLMNLKENFTKHTETLLARPKPLRAVFAHLRHNHPVFTMPGFAIVSKYDDVLDALAHENNFSVTEIYAEKMRRETGDFVLGMGDTPQYHHERDLMQQAVRPEDLETIRQFVAKTAEEIVASAAPHGRMDVVSQLSRVVPSRLVGFYFGTPGPDEATQMRWMRTIFRDIFLNLGNDEGERNDAVKAGNELTAYLNDLIATRKTEIAAHPDNYDDFLSRLIKIQIAQPGSVDDDTIRRILGGTIVGTVDTNSKAIAQALDQLLDRPDALQGAQEAARADADKVVKAYIFEALRFNPQNPFLIRHCDEAYVIAKGTPREKEIAKGSLVIIGTTSAMFDEAKVPDPDDFRIDRAADNYLHFGYGNHTCFGQHIAQVVIPGTAKALLKRHNLRRAANDGQIEYDGAFPDHFVVEFDA